MIIDYQILSRIEFYRKIYIKSVCTEDFIVIRKKLLINFTI